MPTEEIDIRHLPAIRVLTLGTISAVAFVLVQPSAFAAAPSNDEFAAAATISGDSGTVDGSTVDATAEPGEPAHAGQPAAHSVWYVWSDPSHQGPDDVDFWTSNATGNTRMAVYTGSSVSDLTLVTSNDDQSSSDTTSRVAVPTSGQYYIAVDAVADATSDFTLNWGAPPSAAVTALSTHKDDVTHAYDVTWTVPAGEWGSRICAIHGTTPVTSAACTGAQMVVSIAGTGPQSQNLACNQECDGGDPFPPPYAISVFSLDGPGQGPSGSQLDPTASDAVSTTRLAASFGTTQKTPVSLLDVPYGEKFTFSQTLIGIASGQPIANGPVDVILCQPEADVCPPPVARVYTNSSGVATYTVNSVRSSMTVGLAFTGNSTYFLASAVAVLTPVAWGTIHKTRSTAKVGKTIGVYGDYTYADRTGSAQLQVRKSGSWHNLGTTVPIKKQKLLDGSTVVGYVAHVTRPAKGRYAFRMVLKSVHGSCTTKSIKLRFTR